MDITTIVLAGGNSRRMGSNKALIPYRGKPLIRHALDLAVTFSKGVLISSDDSSLKTFGFPVIADLLPEKAPLTGIHAGLAASKTPWNLILSCDMPNIPEALIRILHSELKELVLMVLPGHEGFLEPLCGFYHRDLIPRIEELYGKGRYSPVELLSTVSNHILPMESYPLFDPRLIFKNMNERKDLQD